MYRHPHTDRPRNILTAHRSILLLVRMMVAVKRELPASPTLPSSPDPFLLSSPFQTETAQPTSTSPDSDGPAAKPDSASPTKKPRGRARKADGSGGDLPTQCKPGSKESGKAREKREGENKDGTARKVRLEQEPPSALQPRLGPRYRELCHGSMLMADVRAVDSRARRHPPRTGGRRRRAHDLGGRQG